MGMKSPSVAMPPRVKARGFEERRVGELVGSRDLSVEREDEMGLSRLVIGDDGGDESVVEEDGRVGDAAEDREGVG